MKPIIFLELLLLITACSQPMKDNDVESYIKADKKNGFSFVSTPSKNQYIINYQNPNLKSAWGMVIAITGDVAKNELPQISIGTTLWKGKTEPSKDVLLYLLAMNTQDKNIGTLSLFKQGDEYFIQFFIRRQLSFMTEKELEFDIGFVAGYADSISEKLKGYK